MIQKEPLSLRGKTWNIQGKKKPNESLVEAFFRIRGLEPKDLIEASISDLASPSTLPNIDQAKERIEKALQANETILLFGDFDVDGLSGTAILYMTLRHLGAKVIPMIPSRQDGYGLSQKAYDFAEDNGCTLVITIDCGSSNVSEIQYGNAKNIDTIITDHHTIPEERPAAIAICHPHIAESNHPLYDLTGSGVAFFVALALLGDDAVGMLPALAELAVLGTVADVGVLRGQNRILTQIGVNQLQKSKHPGLKELFRLGRTDPASISSETIGFSIAPRLNAAGRMGHPNTALALLLGNPDAATELEMMNERRREVVAELLIKAQSQMNPDDACHILFDEDFLAESQA